VCGKSVPIISRGALSLVWDLQPILWSIVNLLLGKPPMSKKGAGHYKNRLAVEFIKAEIRAGLAMISVASNMVFYDAGCKRRAIASAREAYFTARELAVGNRELVTEDAVWIAKNLYKLELALNRLGNQEG
jgi:hypothetical protein